MIYLFNMKAKENFKKLCDLTTSIMGLPKGSLSNKSRKTELQVPRAAAAVVATMDNIHCTVIAEELKRDRSLIYHYNKMHSPNYSTWEKYRNTFNQIYMAYSQLENARKQFFDLQHLKDHLKQAGVCNSEKHQTSIMVTCGKVGTEIKVSYRDFYNQLELCKLALQDYKFEIEIK
tara:strand:- start:2881 stop:3405 length:525 start_codon:yes stop_codon:yes gene_type:complete